jgi:hypothetical protein
VRVRLANDLRHDELVRPMSLFRSSELELEPTGSGQNGQFS